MEENSVNSPVLSPASSAPSLPQSLNLAYSMLSLDNRKLFNKVFLWVWHHAIDVRSILARSGGAVSVFWVLDRIRDNINLTASQLSMLTFIYYSSGNGKQILHSEQVYNGPYLIKDKKATKRHILSELVNMGIVTRSRVNSSSPYLQSSHDLHPVYIKLSVKGVKMVQDIERDLYKILLNTSLDDITGANKRP